MRTAKKLCAESNTGDLESCSSTGSGPLLNRPHRFGRPIRAAGFPDARFSGSYFHLGAESFNARKAVVSAHIVMSHRPDRIWSYRTYQHSTGLEPGNQL